jgi:hypothetical protein
MMDWNTPDEKISKYFTIREALFLPSWGRLATCSDGLSDDVSSAITAFAQIDMDRIRDYIGLPIEVHCWYRPVKYNQASGGAAHSAHTCLQGYSACDWSAQVEGVHTRAESCEILRRVLLPMLEDWGIRMEDNGKEAPWIHIDNAPVLHSRFFKP